MHTHYPQIKGAHALLRSDWHWPRVVVTEIMELSEECVNILVNLGLLKKTSRKQFTISTQKIILIPCIISLLIYSSIVATFKEGVYQFREFWPVLSDVPTHHFGERSAVKISTFFTLIISLFLCIF